jgi:hypothetical protein
MRGSGEGFAVECSKNSNVIREIVAAAALRDV